MLPVLHWTNQRWARGHVVSSQPITAHLDPAHVSAWPHVASVARVLGQRVVGDGATGPGYLMLDSRSEVVCVNQNLCESLE